MPSTNRIEILRKGRRVGFAEIRDFREADVSLPGMHGNDRGFAIVTEIGNRPVAALVFPWRGESIDITETVHWSSDQWEDSGGEFRAENTIESLRDKPSLFQLAGEIRLLQPHLTEHFDFRFRFEEGAGIQGLPFRLEIDDEREKSYLHCRFVGEPPFEEAFVRGTFESSSAEGDLRADVRFEFMGRGFGGGEGYFRGRAASRALNSGRSEFRFRLETLGSGLYGEGRFSGGDLTDFPFLGLLEQTLKHVTSRERLTPFRIWIGAVRYASVPERELAQRRRIAAMLAGSAVLGANEVNQVAHWLASTLPHVEFQGYARALSPILKQLQKRERVHRVQRRDLAVRDLTLQFDDSVSAEKRIQFLIALADQVLQVGGRLCFARPPEQSP